MGAQESWRRLRAACIAHATQTSTSHSMQTASTRTMASGQVGSQLASVGFSLGVGLTASSRATPQPLGSGATAAEAGSWPCAINAV
jgi:hypothetical protein